MIDDLDSVEVLSLSARSMNVLRMAGVHTIGELRSTTDQSLLRHPSCGAKSVREIREALKSVDLVAPEVRQTLNDLHKRIATLEGENAGLRFALECIANGKNAVDRTAPVQKVEST
jgi:hypothetical protein